MNAGSVAVRWFPSVESTQDAVHALAEQGAAQGVAVAALEQTAGRGSRRRDWASPPGGLWLSVLLRPRRDSGLQVLSLRAGLAIVHTLDTFGAEGLMLKWPNDIMAHGKKAGGILCEARWNGDRPAWVAVGVGLNVRNELPDELRSNSARLVDHGVTAELEPLAQRIAEALVKSGEVAGPLSATELAALAGRDWLRDRQLTSPQAGRAAGIESDGALRVRRADGSLALVRAAPVEAAAHVTLTE
ncbi:MAG TPA: biotin--[acetyl-CoA-carboxylase] ligase [Gemmatimonadales bacterium]|nr:biotin--[acetyl-CoA-carboxylase] ligase [Gemmatimonadales bacterium]